MVHIELDDLCIQSDPKALSWKLYKKGTRKKKEIWIVFAHYGTLIGAINGVLRYKLTNSNAKSLEELRTLLEDTKKELFAYYNDKI